MNTQNIDTLNTFVIETILIDPIAKIVDGLNSGSFRDCDINWLDSRLEKFISFAAETLGYNNIITPSHIGKEPFTILNEYTVNYYLDKFTTLLNYFKSFNN